MVRTLICLESSLKSTRFSRNTLSQKGGLDVHTPGTRVFLLTSCPSLWVTYFFIIHKHQNDCVLLVSIAHADLT